MQKVIDRVLAKDPDARYQTCRELAADYMDAIGMVSEANTVRTGTSLPVTRQPEPVTRLRRTGSNPQAHMEASSSVFINRAPFPCPRHLGIFDLLTRRAGIRHAGKDAAVGLLRFQDGTAPGDQVTISTSNMEAPPQGSQYEAWLIQDDGEQRISIGCDYVRPAKSGIAGLCRWLRDRTWSENTERWRSRREPDPDPSPNSSNDVAFSGSLPPGGLTHVRHLLFSFNATPEKVGFIHGLEADTLLLNECRAADAGFL